MQFVPVTPRDIRRPMEAETPGGADAPKAKEKSPEEQIQAALHWFEQSKHIYICFCNMGTQLMILTQYSNFA